MENSKWDKESIEQVLSLSELPDENVKELEDFIFRLNEYKANSEHNEIISFWEEEYPKLSEKSKKFVDIVKKVFVS